LIAYSEATSYPRADRRALNKSCPRNQKGYKDAAIRLDGGFLLLRYKEFQFVFAFCTEEFDDQFAAIVTGAVDTFFVFWHFFEFGIQKV